MVRALTLGALLLAACDENPARPPLDLALGELTVDDIRVGDRAVLDTTFPDGAVDRGPVDQAPSDTAPPGRNLNGSHTQRVTAACTLYVKPGGDDGKDGKTLSSALKTPTKAVELAQPGDVVCFDAGSYPTMTVKNVTATASAPLVFRTVPGEERKATFGTGKVGSGHGISVELSDHIHVYDLHLTSSEKGIDFMSVAHGRIEGLLIESLGQEAIHVGRKRTYDGSNQFLGPASHHCDVIGNRVSDTGKVTAIYGEGIYIGTGAFGGDDTHDIFIAYNHLDTIRAEAIELKPHAYNLTVRGNLIESSSHDYNAALTVAIEAANFRDGSYLIEDNRIHGYTSTQWSVAGITIGHGNAVIRNNVIWNIDGGRGIRTYTTFANPAARDVTIANNTIWNPGTSKSIALNDGDGGTGVKDKLAQVTLSDNATDDGAAASTKVAASDFVGPVSGAAEAGDGPGSGFRFKSYQGLGADLTTILVK